MPHLAEEQFMDPDAEAARIPQQFHPSPPEVTSSGRAITGRNTTS
jgi:hypothetical protein